MFKVDWSESEGRELPKDGVYLFEVESAEVRTGKVSGAEYISLLLRCPENRAISVFDNLSFTPGAKNILQAKLRAFGLGDVESIDPSMLFGRRIKAAIKKDKGSDGVDRMIVDISARGSKAGYYPDPMEEKKPSGFDSFDSDITF